MSQHSFRDSDREHHQQYCYNMSQNSFRDSDREHHQQYCYNMSQNSFSTASETATGGISIPCILSSSIPASNKK
jgi:hypothetical protein